MKWTKLDNTRRKRLKIKVRTEEYWKVSADPRAKKKKNDINLQFKRTLKFSKQDNSIWVHNLTQHSKSV